MSIPSDFLSERFKLIISHNTAQAVLIPYQDFAAYQAWREQRCKREVWLAELRALAEEVSSQTG